MEEKEKAYSKERIKAEMGESRNNSIGCGLAAGFFIFIAVCFTVAASSPYASGGVGVIALLLWIIALALAYGGWTYDQHYKKWKSLL